ncbi:type II toxin-antitoxin system VapC family toxin [Paenibacillus lycopersici]|uniref:Ribonuclease VapC n=1 Tax=Paenibacillus lycopersici TaxID=2704462 RepID=A0A6C0FYS1_9BACL|nr:PIN domain-containing protein [Paenibacillus lycopersici]QHT59360.1 type II toxin-antitoxin system VapC family toxin [Paenibacillus lycopersici]
MSRGYLLDTNIAIAILTNESNVIDFIQQASRDKMPIYFSAITVSEVFAGLKHEEQLLAEKLFTSKRCIDVTSEIAKLAGTLRRNFKRKGRKLKTPDALIIETASVHELTLVSRDSDMKSVEQELDIPRLNIDAN